MSKKAPWIVALVLAIIGAIHALLQMRVSGVIANNVVDLTPFVAHGSRVLSIVSVVFAAACIVVGFAIKKDKLRSRLSLIGGAVAAILLVATTSLAYAQDAALDGYRTHPSKDYIEKEYIRGYDIDEVKTQIARATDTWMILVGRSDCGGCQNFIESITPFLEEHAYVLPTCYIDVQESGDMKDEMDAFLLDNEISHVPCLLYVQDGKIVEKISKPISNQKRIEELITEMYEHLGGETLK